MAVLPRRACCCQRLSLTAVTTGTTLTPAALDPVLAGISGTLSSRVHIDA